MLPWRPAALPAVVSAQTAEQDSVQNRSRPDFDPIGIELDEFLGLVGLVSAKTIEQKSSPLSSFVVKPSFGVTGIYDSNIFLTEQNAVGDKRVEYARSLPSSQTGAGIRLLSRVSACLAVMSIVPTKTLMIIRYRPTGGSISTTTRS